MVTELPVTELLATSAHGMELILPGLDPPLLVLVQVFIESVFQEWVEGQ